jgi:hypothetical protein
MYWKTKLYIFLLLCLGVGNISHLFGQNYIPYYHQRHLAVYYMEEQAYEQAIFHFQKAFLIEEALVEDNYYLAFCYAAILDKSNCLEELQEVLEKSPQIILDCIQNIDSYKHFQKILEPNELYGLESDAQDFISLRAKKETKGKKILQLIQEFEAARALPYEDRVAYDFRKEDSLKIVEFLNLVEKEGYPDIAKTNLLFLQAPYYQELYTRAKKVLWKEVERGKLAPFYYAQMLERYAAEKGQCFFFLFKSDLCESKDLELLLKRYYEYGIQPFFYGNSYKLNFKMLKKKNRSWFSETCLNLYKAF